MEAIWNYFYWQALTTNPLDDVGHVLRLSVIVNECSPYTTNPSDELYEECNQALGPTQPGVTTPDPTEGSAAAAAAAERDAPAAGRRDAPTGTPTPRELQSLLPGLLTPPKAPPVPAPKAEPPAPAPRTFDSRGAADLLDFLLAP
jgi:hypothetical protein